MHMQMNRQVHHPPPRDLTGLPWIEMQRSSIECIMVKEDADQWGKTHLVFPNGIPIFVPRRIHERGQTFFSQVLAFPPSEQKLVS